MKKRIIYFISLVIIGITIYNTLEGFEHRNIIIIVWSIIMILIMVLDYILSRMLNALKRIEKALKNEPEKQTTKD